MNNGIDLPSLQYIELGESSFANSNTTIIESMLLIWFEMKWIDLPSLQSIKLGEYALCGRADDESLMNRVHWQCEVFILWFPIEMNRSSEFIIYYKWWT